MSASKKELEALIAEDTPAGEDAARRQEIIDEMAEIEEAPTEVHEQEDGTVHSLEHPGTIEDEVVKEETILPEDHQEEATTDDAQAKDKGEQKGEGEGEKEKPPESKARKRKKTRPGREERLTQRIRDMQAQNEQLLESQKDLTETVKDLSETVKAMRETGAGVKPDDDPKPKLEDFEDVEAWADARDEWKQRQAEREAATSEEGSGEEEETETSGEGESEETQLTEDQQRALERGREVLAEGAEAYEDFDQVVRNEEVNLHQYIVGDVLALENAADLLYYLGSNIDEANEIATLYHGLEAGKVAQARERLTELNARIERGSDQEQIADQSGGEGGEGKEERPLGEPEGEATTASHGGSVASPLDYDVDDTPPLKRPRTRGGKPRVDLENADQGTYEAVRRKQMAQQRY